VPPPELLDAARRGDRAALARLLSVAEEGGAAGRELGRLVYPLDRAATVGVTGAPGAGKSTLTGALVARMRADGLAVGVLAIDPSSPFTGGAILGDRVRMGEHVLDPGVFIRSMATRGHLGGLSQAAPEAVRVLAAAGFGWVLLETVGVGQVEVEVAGATDTRVVVVNPGWGDAVQANKAGLLEIADVFVINKADRPGAADTRRDLERMLMLSEAGHGARGWKPPVVETVATDGTGVASLWTAIGEHRAHLSASGELARRAEAQSADELRRVLAARLLERAEVLAGQDGFARCRAEVVAGRLDPWTAVDQLLSD
jgi:LAO/AO transport system kinase